MRTEDSVNLSALCSSFRARRKGGKSVCGCFMCAHTKACVSAGDIIQRGGSG